MGHYTRWLIWPAVLGLGLQVGNYLYYDTLRAAFNGKLMPFFSVFIVLWAIIMLECVPVYVCLPPSLALYVSLTLFIANPFRLFPRSLTNRPSCYSLYSRYSRSTF